MATACALGPAATALALWAVTVLTGLALFGCVALPAALALARHPLHPRTAFREFGPALTIAFATSSSAASLPAAMEAAGRAGCDPAVVDCVLPLLTTINMTGTALYEATTVVFIAQAHGASLGVGGSLVVALTATLAAVGAAAIPSAGLVTMLLVLQAVSLERYAGDLATLMALDWALDRCRTAVNVAADGVGVLLVDAAVARARQDGGRGVGGGARYAALEMTGP